MKIILISITAAVVLSSNAAFAFGDIVVMPPAKEKPDRGNGTDHPYPYDSGRMNQSPIQGRGAFKIVHNEPAPDESAAIHSALWLLHDNSWTCYKPNVKASRR